MQTVNARPIPMPKTAAYCLFVLCATLLTACASHEGTYSPACIAYAGDSIELSGNHFTWDKFTDQVIVNDAGEKVDQFPGYPMRGRYKIDGQKLILDPDTGEAPPDLYLQREGSDYYILTVEQFKEWQETGDRDDCALILGGRPE